MKRPEERTHKAIAGYLRTALTPPWLFFHVPNGGGRSKAEAGVLKAMGVRAGMPDLIVMGPKTMIQPTTLINETAGVSFASARTTPAVVALEVKAPKGSLSPAQKDTIAALEAIGIPTRVVRSIDEAEAALRELGVPLKGRCL